MQLSHEILQLLAKPASPSCAAAETLTLLLTRVLGPIQPNIVKRKGTSTLSLEPHHQRVLLRTRISLFITFILYCLVFSIMALNLAPSQHGLIHHIILGKKLKTREMADVAGCSKRSIKVIRSNLYYFRTIQVPPNGSGRRHLCSPVRS